MSINEFESFNGELAGYKAHYQEAGTTSYYLFANKEGNWYFFKSVVTGAVTQYYWRKQLSTDVYANLAAVWADRGSISGFGNFSVFL